MIQMLEKAGRTKDKTEITVTTETPAEIFYQCQNHPLMGSNLKSSTSADDTVISSSNNELIDSGLGTDTVTYSGNFLIILSHVLQPL